MNVFRTLCLAITYVFVGVAVPAVAQPGPSANSHDAQRQFFSTLRSLQLSDDQYHVISMIIGDGYLSGQTEREIDDRIIAVLDAAQLRQFRDRLGYDPGASAAYLPDRPPSLVAVVHRFAGNAITLTSGRTIFLRDATQFIPSRDAIKPGVRIGIDGQSIQGGNVNADLVGAFDEGFTDFDVSRATSGGMFVTIAATNKSNVTLADGHTVFLRDETVVTPSRDVLRAGSRIILYGVPAGNGNINADRIDILIRN